MRAIAAEEGARAAVTDDERVMAYIGQIQRDIAQKLVEATQREEWDGSHS